MGFFKPSVTIIGTGAVGSALENFFREKDYPIQSTWNSKDGIIYSQKTGEFRETSSTLPDKSDDVGDVIFITTPDDLIKKIAQLLSASSINWEKKTVVHCSGNLTADELSDLSNKGAHTVSMHPIQTFKKRGGWLRFKSITVSLQGDSEGKEILKPLIEEMEANFIVLDKHQKRNLHIAAVMASNYLVALMFSVENLLKDAELKDGFKALEALVHQTMMNIFENGAKNALTGPISRGDYESVQTHLKELKGREQESLYKLLGMEAVKIAERSGNLSENQIDELKLLLKESAG